MLPLYVNPIPCIMGYFVHYCNHTEQHLVTRGMWTKDYKIPMRIHKFISTIDQEIVQKDHHQNCGQIILARLVDVWVGKILNSTSTLPSQSEKLGLSSAKLYRLKVYMIYANTINLGFIPYFLSNKQKLNDNFLYKLV